MLTSSDIQQDVDYSIKAPGNSCSRNGTLSAGDVIEVICDHMDVEMTSSSRDNENKGIYLTANSDKVTVIGQSLERQSSDSYYALPVIKLDADAYVYYGVSMPIGRNKDYFSSILIVGTENNTTLNITTTQFVNINWGDFSDGLIRGTEYSFVINRLQTFYIGTNEDLSGTKIVTDKPVSVFSGHRCARVPDIHAERCSYLIEQIPPTALWGKVHYVAPLVAKRYYTIKILAAHNSTSVSIYCNSTMLRPAHTINEGEFEIQQLENDNYCAIYSNKEVLVVRLNHGSDGNAYGGPMMMLVPSTNQYFNRFEVCTILTGSIQFSHHINVIVMEQYYQPNATYLIAKGVKRSLDTEKWVPIQVNNIIEARATQITDIEEGMLQIFHTNPEAQMMTFVYGFAHDRFESYGHIGGIYIPTRLLNYASIFNYHSKSVALTCYQDTAS